VRVATETLLGDFLREIHDVVAVRKRIEEETKIRAANEISEAPGKLEVGQEVLLDQGDASEGRNAFITTPEDEVTSSQSNSAADIDEKETGGMFSCYPRDPLLNIPSLDTWPRCKDRLFRHCGNSNPAA